jgi:hypothetical protein
MQPIQVWALFHFVQVRDLWDDPMRGTPSNYLSRCEAALTAYDAPFHPDEPPREPPETLKALEQERYISKLIHWGFEAPKRTTADLRRLRAALRFCRLVLFGRPNGVSAPDANDRLCR